jgi:hypothetical protein
MGLTRVFLLPLVDVTFSELIESNGVGPATTNYYQTPSVSGNDLNLRPENLRVEILPGPASDTVASRLQMEIAAGTGQSIDLIALRQLVEYSLLGAGQNDASATATVDYSWEVLEGPSMGVTGGNTINHTASATPNTTGSWNLDFNVDIGAVAAGALRVRFEFENTITGVAARPGASMAGVQEMPGIDVQVTVVPEPAAGMIFVSAGLALAGLRRWFA